MVHEVDPPQGTYEGEHKVHATGAGRRGWRKLCQNRPGPARRCYIDLADRPFPPFPTPRHHQLRGNLKGFWEYEIGEGERVRYKKGEDGSPLIVYAGSSPPDTH